MRLLRIVALVALCLAFTPAPASAVTGFDSAYSGESAFVTIFPGETQSFQVFFSNTGTVAWTKGTDTQVDLAGCLEDKVTCNAQDPSESTWNSGWLSTIRYATHTQAIVSTGSLGTFAYNIKAPANATGTHRFNGDLVLAKSGERIHPQGYYQDATVDATGSIAVPTPTPTPGSTPSPAATPRRTPRPTPTPTPTLGTLSVNGGLTASGCPGEDFVTTFEGAGLAPNTTYQLTRTQTAPTPQAPGTLAEVTTDSEGTFIQGVTTNGAPAPSTYTVVVTLEGTPKTNSVEITFVCDVLRAEPGVFDPDMTDTVAAAWQEDNTLRLSKDAPTPTNSSAGAEITVNHNHFTGAVTELGFDYSSEEGWCGAGAPRFNVYTEADFSDYWAFGCTSGMHTDLGNGWIRVRFDLATDGFHIAAGVKEALSEPATALEIIFDEGTDVGPGFAVLDNIDVNGVLITDSSGSPMP
jgi:hypothetical protein